MNNNMNNITPQIQNHISQMQQVQQQIQSLSIQKSQTSMMIKESEIAIDEINKSSDQDIEVYKVIGEFMIKSKKDLLYNELKEKIENLNIRQQSILRQEERVINKFKQLQDQLKKMIGTKENE